MVFSVVCDGAVGESKLWVQPPAKVAQSESLPLEENKVFKQHEGKVSSPCATMSL